MNNAVKSGLFFGIFMSAWFIFASIVIDKEPSVKGVILGLIEGTVSGFLFGITSHFISKRINKTVQIDLDPGEQILFQSGANHFKGIEAVGGKLSLTEKRLVFKSHSLNFQKHTFSIPLNQVMEVERYKNVGLINNGLKVTTETGTEKFVVDKAEVWHSLLKKNIPSTTTEPR